MSDTVETATIPGTSPVSTCALWMSAISPGILAGSFIKARNTPTTTPAPAVTATHHQSPPNQPGSETSYQLFPASIDAQERKTGDRADEPEQQRVPQHIQNSRV